LKLTVSVPAGTGLDRARTALRELAPDKHPDVALVAASDATMTFEVTLREPDLGAARALRSSLIEQARAALQGADIK
jgi:hypothetical protein